MPFQKFSDSSRHDLSFLQWIMKGTGNRTPIITWRFSDFNSQVASDLNKDMTHTTWNEIWNHGSKTYQPCETTLKWHMHDLILGFYPHFIHESKTKGYDVIGANVFLFTLMRFQFKKAQPVRHILLSLFSIYYKIYAESEWYSSRRPSH